MAKQIMGLFLHLGCGNHIFKGWVNIDLYKEPGVDLVWDLRYNIPFEDNSVDLIFTEHMLEHFTLEDGSNFLKECYRVLRPEGRVRIVVPCIERAIELYLTGWEQQHWIDKNDITSAAEFINAYFRSWGHLFVYDQEQLTNSLIMAGFEDIIYPPYRKSDCPDLCGLEVHNDLIAEAKK